MQLRHVCSFLNLESRRANQAWDSHECKMFTSGFGRQWITGRLGKWWTIQMTFPDGRVSIRALDLSSTECMLSMLLEVEEGKFSSLNEQMCCQETHETNQGKNPEALSE